MGKSGRPGLTVLRFGLLLIATLITACAGFEPFEPRNDRVEGPRQGLFSGESGEFVIYTRNGKQAGPTKEAQQSGRSEPGDDQEKEAADDAFTGFQGE